jgi:hypothetical protein
MKRDQAAALQAGVPAARVVRLENASHDVFGSNESEVLREMNDFIKSLPKPGDSPKTDITDPCSGVNFGFLSDNWRKKAEHVADLLSVGETSR